MVNNRKYLCAAPHPSTWEERTESLLKSLGDNPKKRKRALQRTLSLLSSFHPQEKKKQGPGRKSNAEHAINFYHFALERNEQSIKDTDGNVSDDSEERTPKRKREEEDTDDSDGDDDDKTASSKMSSVNTEDFFAQHNDECEVCSSGGELLCCNTCNLVFHMGCTRPVLQKLPTGNWNCSYCVASGATGHKKEAKFRKRAVAACRQMDRMKEENAEEEKKKKAEEKQEMEKEGGKETAKTGRDGKAGVNAELSPVPVEIVEAEAEKIQKKESKVEVISSVDPDTSLDEGIKKKKLSDSSSTPLDEASKLKESAEPPSVPVDEANKQRKPSPDEPVDETSKQEESSVPPSAPVDETDKLEKSSVSPSVPVDQTKKQEASLVSPFAPVNEASKQEQCLVSTSTAVDEVSKQEEASAPVSTALDEVSKQQKPSISPDTPVGNANKKEETSLSDSNAVDETNKQQKSSISTDIPAGDSILQKTVSRSPDTPVDETSQQRGRRERRPPTIYDPQAGPASSWQSDELLATIIQNGETRERDDESDEESNANDKNRDVESETTASGKKKSGEEVWCSFCKDDSAIPICCFCGCRVCFGKHSGDKLLICDQCDQEYHTFCLKPPLSTVPSSKKWFCPNCKAVKTKSVGSPVTRAATQSTRTRGRGKRNPPPTPKSPERWRVRDASGKFATKTAVSGRKRGRPPKATPTSKGNPGTPSTTSSAPKKRPRGRPRKVQADDSKTDKSGRSVPSSTSKRASPSQRKSPGSSAAKKAGKLGSAHIESGRPLAKAPLASSVAMKASSQDVATSTNQGHSESQPRAALTHPLQKVETINTGRIQMPGVLTCGGPAASAVVSAPPPQRSRSGRTVKRNSFHDEVEEGEQHLRIVKPKTSSLADVQKNMQVAAGAQFRTGPYSKGAETPSQIDANQPLQSATLPLPSDVAKNAKMKPSNASLLTSVAAKIPATSFPGNPGNVMSRHADKAAVAGTGASLKPASSKVPRRKPGARECIQISRRFGVQPIPQKYMDTLLDYCTRGKVEHLIRFRERLDDHARFLESQLAGLETLVKERGEISVTVPPATGEGKIRFDSAGERS